MTKQYIEQEVKFEVPNIKNILKKLKEIGATEIATDFQRTIRFETENDDLLSKGMFLRVRSGHGDVITLKRKISEDNADFKEREEIETKVEDLAKMRKIINYLGFTKEFIFEKYRSNWKYKGAEISVDELPFGNYLEIESTPELINEIAKDLELDNKYRKALTYWDLFEKYKKANNLTGDNIVFPKNYKPILKKR